jgi:Fe-S-cluster formation regulator IscX/YfhJ
MVNDPTESGLKVLPFTPIPDQLPPAGLPTKLKPVELRQTVVSLPAFTVGNERTTIVLEAVDVQPLKLVPVTE